VPVSLLLAPTRTEAGSRGLSGDALDLSISFKDEILQCHAHCATQHCPSIGRGAKIIGL
jgi:hypothetical protein